MVFSSTTFLFLFLPAVIFFYWFPDVCSKITQLFCKKSLDNQDQNLALYSQTANATSSSILENKKESEGNYLRCSTSLAGGAAERSEAEGADCLRQSVTEGVAVGDNGIRKYKNLVLLAFSILFYAWGEPAFVLVMILSIIANYAFGRLIDKFRNKDKVFLWISVVFNLGILFIF